MQITLLIIGAAMMVGALAMVWAPAAIFAVGALVVRAGIETLEGPDVESS